MASRSSVGQADLPPRAGPAAARPEAHEGRHRTALREHTGHPGVLRLGEEGPRDPGPALVAAPGGSGAGSAGSCRHQLTAAQRRGPWPPRHGPARSRRPGRQPSTPPAAPGRSRAGSAVPVRGLRSSTAVVAPGRRNGARRSTCPGTQPVGGPAAVGPPAPLRLRGPTATRAATAALGLTRRRRRRRPAAPGGTCTCRSTRSSSGPDSRPAYDRISIGVHVQSRPLP